MNNFQRGSEWRRWDLHIHTPFTRKNDCFNGCTDSSKPEAEKIREKWDNFFKSILDYIGDMEDPLKAIYAIGVTDYFSIENYKMFIKNKDILSKIPLILPNIELRILPAATETPINLHVIFDPELSTDIIENRFLSKLKFTYNNTPYSATKSSLVQLGKEIDSTITDDFCAEKKALGQYVVNLSDLQELFNNDKALREKALIIISNKSTDGASGVGNPSTNTASSDLTTLREELYKFADAIFSANPNDVKYFIGKREGVSPDDVKRKCGKFMACIHGSDAHNTDKLFEPDNQRYCWIKADPTFNGLKQIIYEPEERVCISDSKPQAKSPYQVIESITIIDNDFQIEPIVFNDKLNCIIGGKSTGKSILLHNLARAIAPKQVQEKCDVSTGKGKNDKNTKPLTLELDVSKLNVRWADNDSTSGQTIVYIPQTYLNRLADSVQETTEIDEIIENVLLNRTDSNGNQLSIKKAELLSIVDSIKSSNTNKILEIIRIHSRIKELTNQITELGGKKPVEQELIKLKQERDALTKELNIKEEDIKKYDDAVANIEVQKKFIDQFGKEIEKVENATIVVQQSEQFTDFSDETRMAIKELIYDIITKANDSWNDQKANIISRLKKRQTESNESYDKSVLIKDGLKKTIESSNYIKELAEKITKESDKLKKIEGKEKIKSEEQTKMDTLIVEVANSYVSLHLDYEDFAAYIRENTANDDSGLQYDVQIPFRQNDFLAKWSELYRATSQQNRFIINVDDFTAEKYTKELLSTIIKKTLNGELMTLKAGAEPEQALRNILDDWYNIKYIVKMGNDSIDVMSPGKKALVLLQLLIDLADSECPILIDQPEDDLDNRSIFEQLIPFIKRKKVNRQIIIVTHNANIVVGADAEEVIVANQDGIDSEKKSKRFEYRSGSIENDSPIYKSDSTIEEGILNKQGIQQHICDILEGGIKAFEKRKNKYRI
ncbi:TrlF family AAA-like ATPase [Sedimentibacter sp.]|uniref:TrlF family AAA-like ATPase n=1 Tax=Sedimentibacter sp. TaxID=1960295 RepID=UPI0028A8FEAA|nr:hypothetical protein [Sedimentibacter sp.]